jgi:hypothetical protein
MSVVDLLRNARELAQKAAPTPLGFIYPGIGFDVLSVLSAGGSADIAAALGVLDQVTPGDWTFLQWVDGASWEDDALIYRYNRKRVEVLTALGKAIQIAQRDCL